MEVVYKIDSVLHKDLTPKQVPVEWLDDTYYIALLKEGYSGRLQSNKNLGRELRTSTVQRVQIRFSTITIETLNTIYTLVAVDSPGAEEE